MSSTSKNLRDPLPDDPGSKLLKLLVAELLRRLEDPEIAAEMSASEFEMIRKLCADNSVSFASIKRGDFGEVAKKAAEEYPFQGGSMVQ
jgi:hypothetical protein